MKSIPINHEGENRGNDAGENAWSSESARVGTDSTSRPHGVLESCLAGKKNIRFGLPGNYRRSQEKG